jgi:hypothetical protein
MYLRYVIGDHGRILEMELECFSKLSGVIRRHFGKNCYEVQKQECISSEET